MSSDNDQQIRMNRLHEQVKKYGIHFWATGFLKHLSPTNKESNMNCPVEINELLPEQIGNKRQPCGNG
jgi:hypothetical protein